jgi:hypothetical protein
MRKTTKRKMKRTYKKRTIKKRTYKKRTIKKHIGKKRTIKKGTNKIGTRKMRGGYDEDDEDDEDDNEARKNNNKIDERNLIIDELKTELKTRKNEYTKEKYEKYIKDRCLEIIRDYYPNAQIVSVKVFTNSNITKEVLSYYDINDRYTRRVQLQDLDLILPKDWQQYFPSYEDFMKDTEPTALEPALETATEPETANEPANETANEPAPFDKMGEYITIGDPEDENEE